MRLTSEESRTDSGAVKIHKNVIASIVAIAAVEIEGVKRVSKGLESGLRELLGSKSYSAIKVDFDRNGDVKIEVPLIIKYGYNIPEVAARVQENARVALERMTNVTIKDIDISVRGIDNNLAP